ncbi:BgTH12-02843 [Blumeria graminis f. sp. triticale]|uniref:BgTH12-02843 n=1 Tax=Blumeria graminis f. sp. triticale TaxID=1689686 RepID=A0A9W4D8B8_BLUGR|nr:BgTH12-02843 [Blumeria graminis f. sp. triticale]
MGQAFSGPNAFKWLNFTPKATAVIQASPFLLVSLFLTLIGLQFLGLLGYYIHYETSKAYKKPKSAST